MAERIEWTRLVADLSKGDLVYVGQLMMRSYGEIIKEEKGWRAALRVPDLSDVEALIWGL